MKIDSKAAVITGASSGIGAELARQLAALGVPVGLTARRESELAALAAAIRQQGGTAVVAPADAADPTTFRAAIVRLAERLGPIDLLIANAGVAIELPAETFSAERFDYMVRVNLLSAAHAIELVLPEMLRQRRGHIVGISSLAAFRGIPRSTGYCATKAALTTLLEGLRVDLRGRGVAVTTVHPGYVHTPMTEKATHPRPFLMQAGPAARVILRGIAARRRVVSFPWPMATVVNLIRLLPDPIFDRIASRLGAVPRTDRAH